MRKERTQKSVFIACSEEGSIIPVAKVELEQIRAMMHLSLIDFETIKQWKQHAPKNSGQWNAIYKLAYDTLHSLAEAFLLLDGVKARSHECVFAYICEKHPNLIFDWDFLDMLRSKRNKSIYYGVPISYEDWKEIETQITIYISVLKKEIEKRLP